jgi:hypothetical protein
VNSLRVRLQQQQQQHGTEITISVGKGTNDDIHVRADDP